MPIPAVIDMLYNNLMSTSWWLLFDVQGAVVRLSHKEVVVASCAELNPAQ